MLSLFFGMLLIVVLVACWGLTLLSLPGNWLMVMAVAIYACCMPAESPAAIGWMTIVVLVVLAGLGELVELLAATAATTRSGGSWRAAGLALLGSLVGSIVGILVGLPIPLIGSLLAAILFAGLGAMAGAVLGEIWVGRNMDASWQVGKGAFWGRLAGTLGKVLVGAVMIAVVVAALIAGWLSAA
jgi:uncharacterized protein